MPPTTMVLVAPPALLMVQVGDVADAVAGKINTPFPIKRKLVEDWENITQK